MRFIDPAIYFATHGYLTMWFIYRPVFKEEKRFKMISYSVLKHALFAYLRQTGRQKYSKISLVMAFKGAF